MSVEGLGPGAVSAEGLGPGAAAAALAAALAAAADAAAAFVALALLLGDKGSNSADGLFINRNGTNESTRYPARGVRIWTKETVSKE